MVLVSSESSDPMDSGPWEVSTTMVRTPDRSDAAAALDGGQDLGFQVVVSVGADQTCKRHAPVLVSAAGELAQRGA